MESICRKCGCVLRPGQLRYRVRIDIISMFDGYVEEPDGDVDMEMERLIEILSRQDPLEAARDVAHSIALVLCRQCRNRLVREYEPEESLTLH